MCERLSELRRAMDDYAADFDAALYSAADCEAVVEHAAAVEKMAAPSSPRPRPGWRAPACARRRCPRRRPSTWLAAADPRLARWATPSPPPAVSSTCRRFATGPDAASCRRPRPSRTRPTPIPPPRDGWLKSPSNASLADLRDDCARTRAAADDSAEARRRRIHRGRYLRRYIDGDGAFNLHFRDNPEVGADVMAVLDARRDQLAALARACSPHASASRLK